ncbi:carboxymuconolactone decarboxylase family protein [Sporomusa aerivorans]|uniref:carboxymuconolactone decarboxylase family protein n=1 Tax=Sporomusa aerivorans TaxID=204936 RepID=UPI00352AD207
MNEKSLISNAFQTFIKEAPEHQKVWLEAVHGLDTANKLDPKTKELTYIAVLAALRMDTGLPFHVQHAKTLGATRDEIIGAILIGLPAAGNAVIQALPIALDAFDGV